MITLTPRSQSSGLDYLSHGKICVLQPKKMIDISVLLDSAGWIVRSSHNVDTSQNNLGTNGWGRATPAQGVIMIVTMIGIARGN